MPQYVGGQGLPVNLKMCVYQRVCDHVCLRGCVNVTWVPMCASCLCVVLCIGMCM